MHGFANPKRFLTIARWLTPVLLVAGMIVACGALAWGLLATPADRLMGETVRILYLHVPAAWLGMGGWTAIAIASRRRSAGDNTPARRVLASSKDRIGIRTAPVADTRRV